ncbi:MAG TPA: polysaccharide biosynthesis tyrosine autokinase [Pyrinomonadaceae bacterium]|nr:polysaccharide biosynthesis tyrosine autokinase [Pyrinomonadaceae bacterium]
MKEINSLERTSSVNGDLEISTALPAKTSANGYYRAQNADNDLHLRDYWRAVRKHLWLIICVVVLVTTLATIYMMRKPNIYEAEARVQVDLENTNPSLGNSKSGSFVFNNQVNDPAYFNTQLQILSGPGLLRRVVKTLDLEHNQTFLASGSERKASTFQSLLRVVGLGEKEQSKEAISNQAAKEVPLTASASSSTREDLVEAKRLAPYIKALEKGLKVEPVKETRLTIRETRLIDVSYSHSDPQIAAKIVNTIAETFVLSNLEKKTENSSTTSDYLQKRIAELQAQIRNGEERLINYAKSNQILSLDASQNTVVERLVGLNKQLLEAENERKLAEAAYKAALEPGAKEAIAEDSNAKKFIDEANLKLAELQQKRAQLLVENTEEWPEVKEINRQIASLEEKIKEASSRAGSVVITNLATKFRQAKAREDSLRAAFERQRGETLTQNEAAINYKIIQQEIETNKGLLDGLLQRSKENDVILAGTPNNIRIVDYAITPDDPIGPKRLLGIALAFMFSLAFGVGLALFLEYLDDTVRSVDDVENLLHLPALATIPSIGSLSRRRLGPGRAALAAANGNPNTELLINADARSPLAEAYRHLRTSVLLSTAGRAPKTLLVTSSLPSEGKTTTAANMAIALAQTGASVLIIDADMRRPRLHSIFGVENPHGLSTLLSSEACESDVLSMIQPHETPGLHVLTSGPIPPNPAELIGSEQMNRLIGILASSFKYIVIDSPPITSFTDGVLLASMVDGVMLVAHGGRTSRNLVLRSRQMLQEVGAKIFGVVLNNVDMHSNDDYYHSYYNYGYGSGAADEQLASATK